MNSKLLILGVLLFSSAYRFGTEAEVEEVEYVDYEYIETRHPRNEEPEKDDYQEEDKVCRKRGSVSCLYQPNVDKYWPKRFYHYTDNSIQRGVAEGNWVPQKHWPPRDLNGKEFKVYPNGTPTADAVEQWAKTVDSKYKEFDAYLKAVNDSLAKQGLKDDPNERLIARPYPYCVDGKLPRNRLPDPFKYRQEHGGAYPFSNTDPHLERFIPFFRYSLLRGDSPYISLDEKGISPSPNFDDSGSKPEPYVKGIYFAEIQGPGVKGVGVKHLKNWFHIIVVANIPLEGLYIQANGHPMGLPFGQFRTDFDCDMGKELPPGLTKVDKVTDQNPQEFFKYQTGATKTIKRQEYHLRKTQELTVPCKYNHGDSVTGKGANVFAYGGSVPDLGNENEENEAKEFRIKWPKRTHFRMHFSYDNEHCGVILRMQFLILAIKSFANGKYEQYLTGNYIAPQHYENGVGVAFPFSPSWNKINGGMKCPFPANKKLQAVQEVQTGTDEGSGLASRFPELKNHPLLVYAKGSGQPGPNDTPLTLSHSSAIPIHYHGGYDNCIVASGMEEDYMIVRSRTQSSPFRSGQRDTFIPPVLKQLGLSRSGLPPYHGCANDDAECLTRAEMHICPPSGHLCLVTKWGLASATFFRGGSAIGNFFQEYRKTSYMLGCRYPRCLHPKFTQHTKIGEAGLSGDPDDIEGQRRREELERQLAAKYKYGRDDCEDEEVHCTEGSLNGALFNETITKKYYSKGSIITRRAKGTHTWTMFLAWMTLMGIGTMTGRYYKETGGLNADAKNGIYGMGFWIWFHFLLFLSSLVFIWVGLISDINLRRRAVPCNAYEIYSGPEGHLLKDSCRYSRQVVRVHRVLGYLATVLYHFALITAWGRPMGNLKIRGVVFHLRKIGIWAHVVLAYLSKFICICSVLMFLFPRAVSVCSDIPVWVVITQILSLALFIGGMVLQLMEDKANKHTDKSNFPIPEAVEVADKGKWYWYKIGLVIICVLIHLILFALMAMSTQRIYGKSSRPKPTDNAVEGQQGGFDTLIGLISKTCQVPSLASEEDVKLERYYRSSDFRDS